VMRISPWPPVRSSGSPLTVVVRKGSHASLKHPSRGGRVAVPLHARDDRPWPPPFDLRTGRTTVKEVRAVHKGPLREARGGPLLHGFKNLLRQSACTSVTTAPNSRHCSSPSSVRGR
jgi:hypothetical protein